MGGKIYPIGIQNFEKLRRGGYFYIDKTALIYQLVKTGSYYILSRPRRFGKSLLISTLEAYFQGKQELFEGLAMEKLEKDWVKYPILHLDLNTEKYDTPESLENKLNGALVEWEKIYGEEPSDKSLAMRFEGTACRTVYAPDGAFLHDTSLIRVPPASTSADFPRPRCASGLPPLHSASFPELIEP